MSQSRERGAPGVGLARARRAVLLCYSTFPLDLEKFNGDASWTLPIPARFLIDSHGIIRAAESDPDYTTRPEAEDTLAAVRVLSERH